jgi:hypothetical protein
VVKLLKSDSCVTQDHFRKVVKPSYTNVFRDRGGLIGVVEFENQDDLDLAIRKLDDTEFKNPFERCYVRVIDDSDYKRDRRSRSRSRFATAIAGPGCPTFASAFSMFNKNVLYEGGEKCLPCAACCAGPLV